MSLNKENLGIENRRGPNSGIIKTVSDIITTYKGEIGNLLDEKNLGGHSVEILLEMARQNSLIFQYYKRRFLLYKKVADSGDENLCRELLSLPLFEAPNSKLLHYPHKECEQIISMVGGKEVYKKITEDNNFGDKDIVNYVFDTDEEKIKHYKKVSRKYLQEEFEGEDADLILWFYKKNIFFPKIGEKSFFNNAALEISSILTKEQKSKN